MASLANILFGKASTMISSEVRMALLKSLNTFWHLYLAIAPL